MINLIGILIIGIGFVLRMNTIAVVVVAGIVTGLVAGLPFDRVMEILGKAFIDNRYMSIFLITLPVIGLLERYGLRERVAYLIAQVKSATMGRITTLYLLIRTLIAMFSPRLDGHAQFIRPLILPMALTAAETRYSKDRLEEKDVEAIKGLAAAAENFANFFGQNVFAAAGGVLLIVATLKEQQIVIEALDIAKASLLMAVLMMVTGSLYFLYWDRRLDQKYKK